MVSQISFQRKLTHLVDVEGIKIGNSAPIVVQSMTNTNTADIPATVRQVAELALAGSELVRITIDTEAAAAAVGQIRKDLNRLQCFVPLIGDFHYNGHRLLDRYPDCAQSLAKYRINPGNVGFGKKKDDQFAAIIDIAMRYHKPVRIGVNWGSLDQKLLTRLMNSNAQLEAPKDTEDVVREALIVSALDSARQALELGLGEDRIVISCKVSSVPDLIALYRELSRRCDFALHLGLTEAGMGSKGIVASSAAMGVLLHEGIGDTIRISLTPDPGGSRSQEVIVAQELLQTLGLRAFAPMVIACPGCGRTSSSLFQELAKQVQEHVRENMPAWRNRYDGVENLSLAVMGCIVNGPGESKHANIGISLPGTGEAPSAPVFIDGKKAKTLRGESLCQDFIDMIDAYVASNYSSKV